MSEQERLMREMEAKINELREFIRYWSYCTWQGMRQECPEQQLRLLEELTKVGINPYWQEKLYVNP